MSQQQQSQQQPDDKPAEKKGKSKDPVTLEVALLIIARGILEKTDLSRYADLIAQVRPSRQTLTQCQIATATAQRAINAAAQRIIDAK